MTEKAKQLLIAIQMIDALLAGGATPFQAMAASLNDEDWLLAYVGFKTLVQEANK